MREILDQHAQRLTSGERWAIWVAVSGSRAKAPRSALRWALPAAAAAVAVILAVAFVMMRREPASPTHSGAPQSAARAPRVEHAAPERASVTPEAQPLASGQQAPGVRHEVRHATHARRLGQAAVSASADVAGSALAVRAPAAAVAGPAEAPSAPAAPPYAGPGGALTGRITDARGRPVAYANVLIPGTGKGSATDENGVYRIVGLSPATYSVKVMCTGYDAASREGVQVGEGELATTDVRLGEPKLVAMQEDVTVRAERRIDTKSSTTKQSIAAERLREIPVDNLSQAVASKGGAAAQGGELHFRGGRSGEVGFQFDGVSAGPPQPPVVPTTGGTRLPNDEAFDSMFFKPYGVNPFIAANEDALSTFAVDVDAASYTVARRYLELGHLPPAEAVRVEEFVNFFPQGYPKFQDDDFRIVVDGAPSAFRPGYELLRIGIKGREVSAADRKPARLTFVIDVSGSMAREDRLELVKRALRLLVDRLHGGDRVGIVVFGTQGRVLLQPASLDEAPAREAGLSRDADDRDGEPSNSTGGNRRRILDAIDQLRPEGSTNAEDGLRLGYEMARRGYRPNAMNRVVLCSDGVANVGRTGPESILAQVRTEADRGIHLTTIGFGMGNYNDVLMEQLADKGDGNHYYVDDIAEARRVFVENLTGTLQTIAKDAKVQVEFDSTRVLRYRLLGFENRDVADRDFRNDKVDAGEIGAGHEVTALYEVKLAPNARPGTLATVRLRYAKPEYEGAGAPQVREIAQRFDAAALGRKFEDATPRFRLDAAVAQFAEILRGSYWAKEGRLSDVLSVARSAAGSLHDGASAEFVTLVQKAAELSAQAKPGEGGEGR